MAKRGVLRFLSPFGMTNHSFWSNLAYKYSFHPFLGTVPVNDLEFCKITLIVILSEAKNLIS